MKIALAADLHLRGDRPLCRTDSDWIETQREDLHELFSASAGCDELWVAGDIFHTPRVSTECLNMALHEFLAAQRKYGYTIRLLAGNHDLPEHNYANLDRCSLGVMLKVFSELKSDEYPGKMSVSSHPFGLDDIDEASGSDVWVTHQLTFPDDASRPFQDAGHTARELLDMAPGCRIVITGDRHHGYLFKDVQGRHVITPGCLNIQVGTMKDYQPRIYVWDTATDEVEARTLDTSRVPNISTDYLDEQKERDALIRAAVDTAVEGGAVSLDFKGNLEVLMVKASDGCKAVLSTIMDRLNKDRT